MKKLLVLLLLFLVTCGPSEDEIQSQIDEAINEALQEITTTVADTTTTTVKPKVENTLVFLEFNTLAVEVSTITLREAIICKIDRNYINLYVGGRAPEYNSIIPKNLITDSDYEIFNINDLNCEDYENFTVKDYPSVTVRGCGPSYNPIIHTYQLFIADELSRNLGYNANAPSGHCEWYYKQQIESEDFKNFLEDKEFCEKVEPHEEVIRITKVYANNLFDYFNSLISKNKHCIGFNFSNFTNNEINENLEILKTDKNDIIAARKIEKILLDNRVIFPLFVESSKVIESFSFAYFINLAGY